MQVEAKTHDFPVDAHNIPLEHVQNLIFLSCVSFCFVFLYLRYYNLCGKMKPTRWEEKRAQEGKRVYMGRVAYLEIDPQAAEWYTGLLEF